MPIAFHAAGILDAFHTDIFLTETMARQAAVVGNKLTNWRALSRLAGRTAAGLPYEQVHSYPWLALRSSFGRQFNKGDEDPTARWLWLGERFATSVSKNLGARKGNVYAFTSAARELFQANSAAGGRNILDQATAPRKQEISLVREEARNFASWTRWCQPNDQFDAYYERQLEELELADLVLCASSFAKAAVESEGVNPAKIRVVPLGIEIGGDKVNAGGVDRREMDCLKVIFVGDDGLRKGIGYLDQAVRKLSSSRIRVRIVGNLDLNARGLVHLRERMELLGSVPRSAVRSHFEWADVLVLPSVSDTFGLVVLEALSAGLPVVATNHTCAPDVVREGVDGFIIPIRDSDTLADRLDQLASDPARLSEMSANARERAQDFTLNKYSKRLVVAVEDSL